jgi:PPOX class probable F420-dependent enzyme
MLQRLSRRKTVLLTTYRRDGTPVATAVTLARAGDRLYFRTYDRAGKAKRLRRNSDVEVTPSNIRGAPRGEAVAARARLVEAEEERRARRALARTAPLLQGLLVPLTHRLARYRTLHYELVPRGSHQDHDQPAGGRPQTASTSVRPVA